MKRKLDPYTLGWCARRLRRQGRQERSYEGEHVDVYYVGRAGICVGMACLFEKERRALTKTPKAARKRNG